MRPRVSLVSACLLLLALVHAYWGARMLVNGLELVATTQLVTFGALLLAAVSVRSPATFATALAIAAAATGARFLVNVASPGPFLAPTAGLALGYVAAAWGARSLASQPPAGLAPLALRGGFLLAAASYLGFIGAAFALGNPPSIDSVDLVLRAGAAVCCALFVDAPPVAWPERKRFAGEQPMRAR